MYPSTHQSAQQHLFLALAEEWSECPDAALPVRPQHVPPVLLLLPHGEQHVGLGLELATADRST